MAAPSLERLQEIWAEDDGALFDIFVVETTCQDWQVVVDAVRARSWPTTYTENATAAEMPKAVEDIFPRQTEASILWSIEVGGEVTINCHFFDTGEIEFDFCPREIDSGEALAALLDFISHAGRALRRIVGVTVEGDDHPRPVTGHLYYDPRSDRVVAQ